MSQRTRTTASRTAGLLTALPFVALALLSPVMFAPRPGSAHAAQLAASAAAAPTASLTNDQRRAYLHYYSPIILKRAHENDGGASGGVGGRRGHDWITGFFFDGDRDLSNNRRNWAFHKSELLRDLRDGNVDGDGRADSHPRWEIRPTLYTALLEFEADGDAAGKSVVLLYHVYHAMQGRADDVPDIPDNPIVEVPSGRARIHDWERVEIRIDGVTGSPGDPRENVNYVTVTKHGTHRTRSTLDPGGGLTFHDTAFGRHVIVWQAEHNVDVDGLDFIAGGVGPHYNELRLTSKSWPRIARKMTDNAKARLEHRFHYAFVDEADGEAVAWWNAGRIDDDPYGNSAGHGRSRDVRMDVGEHALVRLTYELQDIADIFPGHRDDGGENPSWTAASRVAILFDDPLLDMNTCPDETAPAGCLHAVPGGMRVHEFLREARDVDHESTSSTGYPTKDWIWGTYGNSPSYIDYPSSKGQFTDGALAYPGYGRCAANRIADACTDGADAPAYFYQHDYFARRYERPVRAVRGRGRWLPRGWHRREAGGFDGRWVQLFADPPLVLDAFACGDATYDGDVGRADALRIAQCVLGAPCGTDTDRIADVNGDGSMTTLDALLVLRMSQGEDIPPRCRRAR